LSQISARGAVHGAPWRPSGARKPAWLSKKQTGIVISFWAPSSALLLKVEATARAVAEGEHELDLFVGNPKLLSLLGEQKFVEGVEARQRALDAARQELAEIRSQSALADELADGDLLQAWPTLTTQEKRG
jgi:hypothetical protein